MKSFRKGWGILVLVTLLLSACESTIDTEISRLETEISWIETQNAAAADGGVDNGASEIDSSSTIDISGKWNSSLGWLYDITQSGSEFTWIVTHQNITERASGSISGLSLEASWSDPNGSGSGSGVIVATGTKAIRIEWDNGVIFTKENQLPPAPAVPQPEQNEPAVPQPEQNDGNVGQDGNADACQAYDPLVMVSPNPGKHSATTTFSLSGFLPNELVEFQVNFLANGFEAFYKDLYVDGNGSATIKLNWEASDENGQYRVRVIGSGNGDCPGKDADEAFIIEGEYQTDVCQEIDPHGSVDPFEGPHPTTFTFIISGFVPNSTLRFEVRRFYPLEKVYSTTLNTDGNGNATIKLDTEATDEPGIFTADVYSDECEFVLTLRFTILD